MFSSRCWNDMIPTLLLIDVSLLRGVTLMYIPFQE